MTRHLRILALLTAFALGGAACDGGDGETAGSTTTTEAPVTTTEAVAEAGETCPATSATTTAKESEAGNALRFLADVRVNVETLPCSAAVAFTFEPAPGNPQVGLEAAYATGPFTDVGGRTVAVEGSAFLRIVFLNGTAVDLSEEEPRETYTGTPAVRENPLLAEVVKVSDFEGSSEWVIALGSEHPFEVEQSPAGVIVTLFAG